ncbi:thiamine phosphate synthase [Hymenobacter arizonensis]|uniref:Thiamine-phosphate pyrophosphorylase n=1 Tax=Hymenobacter arizonensis TaxID=1227077 RepID=A0A1I6B9N5_HYMAR|nr:thiamine phosphate synthase [Hymenobacter arizonensis]SFQ77651.1 thiamine-phosphate pyrophosphorylase [Hymenobacter arizonensis]
MRLVLISPPQAVANETHLASELLDQGLARFHVRKPTWSRAEVTAYLADLPAHHYPRLVLHSHHSLAAELGLGGVHLTAASRHRGPRPTLQPGQTLSTSFHTLAEIRQHRRRYDYVFLSPIFDSLSKSDYPAAFTLTEITAALGQLRRRAGYAPQVLALGGVEAARLPAVQQAGFAGAAVLGAVWQSPDPVAAFRELQSIIG